MFETLLCSEPSSRILAQHASNKVLRVFRHIAPFFAGKVGLLREDTLIVLRLVLATKRKLAAEQNIQDDAAGPNINRLAMGRSAQHLGGNIVRGTDEARKHGLVSLADIVGKAKIGELDIKRPGGIGAKKIFQLDVAVGNASRVQIGKRVEQIEHDGGGVGLSELGVLCDEVEELTTCQILHDKMNASRTHEHINSPDDIGMGYAENDLYLPRQKLRLIFPVQPGDHFDGDLLIRKQIVSEADLSVHALPNEPPDAIILLDVRGHDARPPQGDDPLFEGVLVRGDEGEGAVRKRELDLSWMRALLDDGVRDGDMPGRRGALRAMRGQDVAIQSDETRAAGAQGLALLGEPAVEIDGVHGGVAQGVRGGGAVRAQQGLCAFVAASLHGVRAAVTGRAGAPRAGGGWAEGVGAAGVGVDEEGGGEWRSGHEREELRVAREGGRAGSYKKDGVDTGDT